MALPENPQQIPQAVKFGVALTLNTVVAVIGTGMAESQIGVLFHPQSLSAILWKTWTVSVILAFLLGMGVWRKWRSAAAKWVWLVPSVWFALRFFLSLGTWNLWFKFSGAGCVNGTRSVECLNFFIFTIPFMRALFYSLGAYVSEWFTSRKALRTALNGVSLSNVGSSNI